MDIQLLRTPAGLSDVMRSEAARGRASFLPEIIASLDAQYRELKIRHDADLNQANKLQEQVTALFREKNQEEGQRVAAQRAVLKERADKNAVVLDDLERVLHGYLGRLGNLVHESVPVSSDEANNGLISKWGEVSPPEGKLHHSVVLHRIGGYEHEAGYRIAGSRAYFLMGAGVQLNMALQAYGLKFLSDRGYNRVSTPLFMDQSVMAKTAQLSDFDEQLYKVTGDGEDKYLIATSEQPLTCMHMDEWIDIKRFPIRYAGVSTCFRKEAGSGADVKGIFRVHQFEKVEQFCLTTPEESWAEHEKMLKCAEDFYQSLKLPYRVVSIVSGALNDAAAKKYDLEAWFPEQQQYRELVSCSNCTDYQSRKLLVRAGFKVEGEKAKYAHMLNCTLVATTRTVCCILENYQTADGVIVPEVLRPYLDGLERIPYVQEAPVEKVVKGKGKGKGK